jgi:Tol biopolymer transport system component
MMKILGLRSAFPGTAPSPAPTAGNAELWEASAKSLSERSLKRVTPEGVFFEEFAELASGRLLAKAKDGRLWMMNADGSQPSPFGLEGQVQWPSVCGDRVLYLKTNGTPHDNTRLTVVDLDGTHERQIVSGTLWSPVCSADKRSVYYVTLNQPQKIWRIAIDGGTPSLVAPIVGDDIMGRLSMSPDGSSLAYPYTFFGSVPSGGWMVDVVALDTGSSRAKLPIVPNVRDPKWAPDCLSIEYLLDKDGVTNLWAQPLAGGAPRQLTKFSQTGRIRYFSHSRDGSRLIVDRINIRTDVVLIRPPLD